MVKLTSPKKPRSLVRFLSLSPPLSLSTHDAALAVDATQNDATPPSPSTQPNPRPRCRRNPTLALEETLHFLSVHDETQARPKPNFRRNSGVLIKIQTQSSSSLGGAFRLGITTQLGVRQYGRSSS